MDTVVTHRVRLQLKFLADMGLSCCDCLLTARSLWQTWGYHVVTAFSQHAASGRHGAIMLWLPSHSTQPLADMGLSCCDCLLTARSLWQTWGYHVVTAFSQHAASGFHVFQDTEYVNGISDRNEAEGLSTEKVYCVACRPPSSRHNSDIRHYSLQKRSAILTVTVVTGANCRLLLWLPWWQRCLHLILWISESLFWFYPLNKIHFSSIFIFSWSNFSDQTYSILDTCSVIRAVIGLNFFSLSPSGSLA
jgi:hypothetical protein